MYNLIEYPDNYSDSAASLYQFKRQEQSYHANNPKKTIPLSTANSSSFKYKSGFLGTTETQIAADTNPNIPYISSFFRSLEMPLINTKLSIQLNYTKWRWSR